MKRLKTAILVSNLTVLLCACGADKSGQGSGELMSRGTGGAPLAIQSAAECNYASVPQANIDASLRTFLNPDGSIDYERIRLRFARTPSTVLSGPYSLEIHRWGYVGGQRVAPAQAAPLYFQMRSSGAILNANAPVTSVSASTLQSVISAYGLSAQGITLANVFQFVDLVVGDVDMDYDVFVFRVINTSSYQLYASGQALIPAFAANPNTYAQYNPVPDLQVLHPQWTVRGSGFPDSAYLSYFRNLCD